MGLGVDGKQDLATVKPWRTARILAKCGIDSSDRYSSSPVTKTICFPLPGPSLPSNTTHGSATLAHPAARNMPATAPMTTCSTLSIAMTSALTLVDRTLHEPPMLTCSATRVQPWIVAAASQGLGIRRAGESEARPTQNVLCEILPQKGHKSLREQTDVHSSSVSVSSVFSVATFCSPWQTMRQWRCRGTIRVGLASLDRTYNFFSFCFTPSPHCFRFRCRQGTPSGRAASLDLPVRSTKHQGGYAGSGVDQRETLLRSEHGHDFRKSVRGDSVRGDHGRDTAVRQAQAGFRIDDMGVSLAADIDVLEHIPGGGDTAVRKRKVLGGRCVQAGGATPMVQPVFRAGDRPGGYRLRRGSSPA